MAEILYATSKWHIGVSPDSMHYLDAARGIASGHGVAILSEHGKWEPMLHWPPLYPALLALPMRLGADRLQAARWINALIFAGILLLSGLIVWRQTRSRWASLIAAAIVALGPPILHVHVNAWSEPLFILLTLAALAASAEYLHRPGFLTLTCGGLLAGAAMLTRYAGVALPPALCAGIVLFSSPSLRRRLRDAALLGLIAFLPYAVWAMIHGRFDRTAVPHFLSASQAIAAASTLRAWFFPGIFTDTFSMFIAVLLLGLLTAAPLALLGRADAARPARGVMLIWLFALIYPVTILVSVSYFDADIPMDYRIFSPLFIAVILLAACAAGRQKSWPAAVGLLAAFTLLSLYFVLATVQLHKWHRHGAGGYTAQIWQESQTLDQLKGMSLAGNTAIYSNRADVIRFCLEIPAHALPGKIDESTARKNDDFQQQLAGLRRHGSRVLFVMFQDGRKNQPNAAELQNDFPLRVLAAANDGMILQLLPPSP